MSLKKHQIKLYYCLNSPESEVFRFLKRQKAIDDLSIAMANFYWPHALLQQKANKVVGQFDEALLNLISSSNERLALQQKELLELENSKSYVSKKSRLETGRTSITLNFSSYSSSVMDEVLNYFLNFSGREINRKVKDFAIAWYLFTVRYQAQKSYSYSELKFAYERGKNWIFNQTNYLKSFLVDVNQVIELEQERTKVVSEPVPDRAAINKQEMFF